MKKILILAFITGATLLSCTKKNSSPQPQVPSIVTINGTDYSTVKIGIQTWTSINYNGAGGVNYSNSATNIPANGKLYTLAEANTIILPAGWRIPSQGDYNTLLASLGAVKASDGTYAATTSIVDALISKSGWSAGGGTNSSGFNATTAGYYHNSIFNGNGTDAVFLTTSTLTGVGVPASFNIYQDNTGSSAVFTDIVVTAMDRGSLRFVKDN